MEKSNITLYVPKIEDYWYEQKLLSDLETMYYNAGYESDVEGYDYNTGCIAFDPSTWKDRYEARRNEDFYLAYIKDEDKFVGYISYQYDKERKIYKCGMLIDANERDRGYAKKALKLLIDVAKRSGIKELYSCFEDGRGSINNIFLDSGFEIVKTYDWVRFNEPTKGVLVRIKL
jgi:diamine N-acetyltransferase